MRRGGMGGGVCGRVKTNYKIRFFNGSKEGDIVNRARANTPQAPWPQRYCKRLFNFSVLCVR